MSKSWGRTIQPRPALIQQEVQVSKAQNYESLATYGSFHVFPVGREGTKVMVDLPRIDSR